MPKLPSNTRNVELATIRRNHLYGGAYPLYGGYRLLPKDDLLIEHGHNKSYDIYRDLLRDPHVHAVTQKRWLSVVGREWEVKPASEKRIDKKAAELVERQLKAIGSYGEEGEKKEKKELIPNLFSGFDQVCYNLLKGELYGFQPSEIIWGSDGKEIYPLQIKSKSPRRFVYTVGDKNYLFRLLTPESPWEGEPLPTKKFIIHTYDPEDDNPYGWGLGTRLFYPVLFKRELARFSLIYADKFGSPTGKATYPKGREDIKETLLEAMDRIAQESGLAIEEGTEFDWIAPPAGAGVNIYTDLMDYFDREISKAVLGETGSTDQQGTGGSRARDQVGNEVRIEITKASSDLLSETLNRTLIKWITWYNFGDRAQPPSVWRLFPELEEKEDLGGRAQRDSTLSSMMELKPTRKYVEETYGIEFQDPEPEGKGLQDELGSIFGQSSKEQGASSNEGSNKEQVTSNENALSTEEQTTQEEQPEEAQSTEFESQNNQRDKENLLLATRYSLLDQPLEFRADQKIINWNGLAIALEYLPGDKRFGKTLNDAYGHILNHVGEDGSALDCYVHRNAVTGNERYKTLYRISQLDKSGEFDKYKFMLGYSSKSNAKKGYLALMPKQLFGEIRAIALSELKQYQKSAYPSRKTAIGQIADQAVELAIPEIDKMRSRINREVQRINKLAIEDSAKFAQLQESLYSLYSELDTDKYGEILSEAIAIAEFTGRFEVIVTE